MAIGEATGVLPRGAGGSGGETGSGPSSPVEASRSVTEAVTAVVSFVLDDDHALDQRRMQDEQGWRAAIARASNHVAAAFEAQHARELEMAKQRWAANKEVDQAAVNERHQQAIERALSHAKSEADRAQAAAVADDWEAELQRELQGGAFAGGDYDGEDEHLVDKLLGPAQ